MDLDLKQWRDHHSQPTSSALPLFLSEPNRNLSAFLSDHTTRIPPRMESYFSSSQWQELELQALIFRHMSAGADIPPELVHLVKKSLITSPFYHYYPHFQPSLLQSGYWGRAAMDPEPGRCRRTDGKKWRCSRDVVAGQKYCERHMHRGRNRSRKPVENPTSATSPYASTRQPAPPQFTLSVPSHSTDLLPRPHPDSFVSDDPGSGRTLRHFFDDWPPKPLHDTVNAAATTNLSISMPGNGNDFSLKLGTGDGDNPSSSTSQLEGGSERDKPQINWGVTWGTNAMGGPLAEVLRLSTSNSSPTSVLHRPPRAPASDAT
ncbi:growth-regulating factor 3-like [Salvia divinorum]|uniref:Growth-regulating factor n=1 Tax=Salvia divinorum TaxID=28513 RepID=A0ABD1GEA2_SALDI